MKAASSRLNKVASSPTYGVSSISIIHSLPCLRMNPFIPDKVQEQFPWYKRMHALMGTSPIVDRSAIANSTSDIDLTVLQRPGDGAEARTVKKARSKVNYLFLL